MKAILRASLRMTPFIPIKKNKILFFAGMRGYTCSPKYIAEYLNTNYPGKYELCWIGKDPEEVKDYPYIKYVKFSPFPLFYALASSKVFVTNGENAICPKSKRRLILCTWHGVPYKKIGYASADKFALVDMKHSAIDVFISASQEYTDKVIKGSFHYDGEVLNSGYPRNDIFLNEKACRAAGRKIREHYNIKGTSILFAPTYRGTYQTGEKIDFKLDFKAFEKAVKEKFGDKATILVRMHYFDKNQYDLPETIVDVGDWPDMQEIMCAADILITDYSSTIWDFALTGRPCLLYLSDLEMYKSNRGLYSDPNTWPGIECRSMDELCDALQDLDEQKCQEMAKTYLEKMGSFENGTASQKACERLISFIEK